MKFARLARRFRWVMLCSSLFLVGLYVGRLSRVHPWVEFWCMGWYLFAGVSCAIPLIREAKREQEELRALMQEMAERIRQSQREGE